MTTNLFVENEKRAMFDLINSNAGNPMPAKKKTELKAILATNDSHIFVLDALYVVALYRPSLMKVSFDAAIDNKCFLEKVNASDFACVLLEYALIVGSDAAAAKFISLSDKDWAKEPLSMMINLTVERHLCSLTMTLFKSGLLNMLGIDLKVLLDLSYAKGNKMLCFFMESQGVHLEQIPPRNACWYTHFGTGNENQMIWLSQMKEFRFSVNDLSIIVDNKYEFPLLNNDPKLCLHAMCAAEYYRNLNGFNMSYFLSENAEEGSGDRDGYVISHHDMTIEVNPDGISVISDSGCALEKFIIRFFMEMLLKPDFRHEKELRSSYESHCLHVFDSKKEKDFVVNLLKGSLEVLRKCEYHLDTMIELLLLLDTFGSTTSFTINPSINEPIELDETLHDWLN
jgi:hypothetical protein